MKRREKVLRWVAWVRVTKNGELHSIVSKTRKPLPTRYAPTVVRVVIRSTP